MKIKTLLGQKYLKLNPAGPGELDRPRSRCAGPSGVRRRGRVHRSRQHDRADRHRQLAEALDTLSATFKNTPEEVQASLTGLSRLSRNVAKRDEQLEAPLQHSNVVTKVLADRNQQLIKLMKDGNPSSRPCRPGGR